MQLGVGLGLTRQGGRGPSFSPADIANLYAWWDASDTATITESGGAVSQLDDKSGNGRDLVQGTAAAQPVTGTHTLNGKNVLYNNGDKLLPTAASVSATNFTFLLAWEHISQDGCISHAPTSSDFIGVYQSGGGGSPNQGIASYAARNNGADVTSFTRGTLYSEFNAQANVTTMSGSGWGPSVMYPWTYFSSALAAEQKMAEFIVYDRVLTATEIGQVEAYLAAKWGVTLA